MSQQMKRCKKFKIFNIMDTKKENKVANRNLELWLPNSAY